MRDGAGTGRIPDSGPEPGLAQDRLTGEARRLLRFGSAAAADLAELAALRREIDGISARLGRAIAGERASRAGALSAAATMRDADFQAAWAKLRAAGLALVAEIERGTG